MDNSKTKNSKMEENSPKKEDGSIALRRSLRHSPVSSSVSPPRKTRRLKESLGSSEKPLKDSESPKLFREAKSSSVPKMSPGNTPEKGAVRRSARNSPMNTNDSVSRNTRSSPNTSLSPSQKLTKGKSSSEKYCITSPNSTSKKYVKKTFSDSPSDKNNENHDYSNAETEVSQKRNLELSPQQERLARTSVASSKSARKRLLTPSPPAKETNGTSHMKLSECSKRLCQRELNEVSAPSETSGALCNSILKSAEDGKHAAENVSSMCKSSTPGTHQESAKENCVLSPILTNSTRSTGTTNKRRRERECAEESVSLDSSLLSKKCKVDESDKDCDAMTIAADASLSSDPVKEISMDETCNAENLLSEFGLSTLQKKEVLAVLPAELKDASSVVILKELVYRLLNETVSLQSLSSPRFSKLLRQSIMKYCDLEGSTDKKHQLSENALQWAQKHKVMNLQHEMELALMTLYYDTGFFRKAEVTATALYKETKKLQDKEKTVKACLCLSKAYHAMGNISKARANITTAKTEALKIYTPPDLQAELDLQSGIMQVAEEKDMETAFSYFKEAATGFTQRNQRARALKYMLLAKLLLNRPEEGHKAVNSQIHVGDIDVGVEALLCITKDAISASLSSFTKTYEKYKKELEDDLVVKDVIGDLYTKMLEKNLLNIISPYERMQISFIAEKINLPRDEVERRLSQMILDGQLKAQLDHRNDCLYVYREEDRDSVYPNSLDTISQLDKTLSLLNRRIKQLL